MKIDITPGVVDYPTLKAKLEEHFPEMTFSMRGKNIIFAKKASTAGSNIVIRKKRIMVGGNFPTIGGTMVFMLCIFLLGFLIPLIVYFAAFHGKMKKVEKEVGAFIEKEYGPGSQEVLDA